MFYSDDFKFYEDVVVNLANENENENALIAMSIGIL